MSNSIFKEVSDDLDNKNGNLVITVKKNGTLDCDDNEALQNWLAGKADINPAISVLRETSPTPSVLEEIENEKQQKREELRQKIILESEEELDEDEIEKRLKELEKDDETLNVKHVSLCLEEYIPPEYSKNYAKEVLNMAGIDNPETLLHDYEYQRMTIQNDHCYTTLTMAINPRVALKKLSMPEGKKPEETDPVKKVQRKDDSQEIKDEIDDSDEEQSDESESESTEVSFSEDDDEDDLDFNVNDRFGQKKPTKRQRRKLAAKRARKQEKLQHQEGEPDLIQEAESPKEPKIRKTKSPKKTLSRTNSLKDFSTSTTPVANPPAKKNIVIYPQAIQGTSGIQKPVGNIVIVKNPKNLSFGNSINSSNPGAGFKTIIDRKFIGGTVVVTRRLIPIQTSTEQQPESATSEPTKIIFPPKVENIVKTEQVIAPPAELKPVEPEKKVEPMEDVRFGEFVPLAAAANLKTKQIPEQISVQTHQNSNDLVNELMVNFDTPVTSMATNLEQQLPPPALPSQSTELEHMDLDDGLPEDILQHVAKLVEHKEIQEIIDNVHEFPDLKHLTETDSMSPNTSITSIVPTTSVVSTPSTPTLAQSILDLQKEKAIKSLPKRSPIRVVRSDGRVIELPPIEAPTTRGAKRRAQGSDTSPAPINISVSKLAKVEKTPSVKDPDSRASSRRSSLAKSEKDGTASGKSSRRQSNVLNETDDMDTDGSWNSEDDPDRLWCICKQPHNNRFMICCDKCEDWFHGKCVNITKAMGREMEQKGKEWTCPNCKQNKDGSANGTVGSGKKSLNQQKLTKFFLKNEKSEDESKTTPGMCVICNIKPARNDSVYCSDECIRSHANKHIDESRKSTPTPTTPLPPGVGTPSTHSSHSHHSSHHQSHHHHHHHSHHSHNSSGSNTSHHVKKESSASNSPSTSTSTGTTIAKSGENKKFSNILKDKNNKVLVYEKTTGKILSLSISPTTSTLNEWLKRNPHCDIVKPGSPQAEMFTKRGEKKQPHHVTTPPIKDEPCLFSNPAKIHTGVVPAPKKSDPKQRVVGQLSPLASMSPRPPLLKSDSTSSIGSKTPGSPGKNSKSGGSNQKAPKEQQKFKRQSSSGSSSSKESKLRVEIDRLNVRKTLKDTLIQRMVEITNPNIKKMTDDEAEDFADRIEQAMFEFNHNDTKDKYKTKYRSLKFNLSDTKNPTLIEKICCKVLSPKQLVELPASALASEELAKWREQESKHQLEIITKCELDALTQNQSHVVKTHKGEEIIEAKETIEELEINNPIHAVNNDVLKTETAEASSSKDRFESYINKTILSSEKQVSNSPLSSPSVSSSTSKKDSRRSRSRSRSRGRDRDHHHHHHHSKSSSKHKKRRSRSKSRERHRSRDDKRRSRSRERDRKHEKKAEKRDKDKPEVKEKKEVTSSVKKEPIKEHKKDDIIVKEEDCNLIDKILAETGCQLKVERPGAPAHIPTSKEEDKPQDMKVEITDETESQIVTSNQIFDEDKLEHPAEKLPDSYFDPEPIDEHPIPISIYSGKLYMVDVAKFDITASIVSGHAEDIVKDIPKVLEVVGRISPRTVWDYVSKLKKIPTKEIVVIRFGSTDEENYDNLFTYLSSKERYGVIKSGTSSIKDFYLVTVEAKKPLPHALLPIDGPGFVEGDNKPDLLIGIIVKMSSDAKQTRKPPIKVSKKSSSSSSSSTSTYKHAPKGDVTNMIDSIIQMAPSDIKSSKTTKLTAGLPVTEIPIKILPAPSKDEDDEPYSPGDSDEDFQKPLSTMKTTSYDETLEKINRAIAARQAEIDLLQNKKTTDNLNEPYSPTGPLSPSSKDDKLPSSSGIFENISLPPNIGDILASIKNVTSTSSSGTVQKMEDDSEEYVPASVSMSNYEYRSSSINYPAAASTTAYQALPLTTPIVPVPVGPLVNPMTMDIDERIFPIGIPIVPQPSTKSSSGDSKLAKMSTEDLLKMVPDFDSGKPENE